MILTIQVSKLKIYDAITNVIVLIILVLSLIFGNYLYGIPIFIFGLLIFAIALVIRISSNNRELFSTNPPFLGPILYSKPSRKKPIVLMIMPSVQDKNKLDFYLNYVEIKTSSNIKIVGSSFRARRLTKKGSKFYIDSKADVDAQILLEIQILNGGVQTSFIEFTISYTKVFPVLSFIKLNYLEIHRLVDH